MSFPCPHKANVTSKEAIGTYLQTTIVGFASPVGFLAELCINTGVLTYNTCCHNSIALYLQNIHSRDVGVVLWI